MLPPLPGPPLPRDDVVFEELNPPSCDDVDEPPPAPLPLPLAFADAAFILRLLTPLNVSFADFRLTESNP